MDESLFQKNHSSPTPMVEPKQSNPKLVKQLPEKSVSLKRALSVKSNEHIQSGRLCAIEF